MSPSHSSVPVVKGFEPQKSVFSQNEGTRRTKLSHEKKMKAIFSYFIKTNQTK